MSASFDLKLELVNLYRLTIECKGAQRSRNRHFEIYMVMFGTSGRRLWSASFCGQRSSHVTRVSMYYCFHVLRYGCAELWDRLRSLICLQDHDFMRIFLVTDSVWSIGHRDHACKSVGGCQPRLRSAQYYDTVSNLRILKRKPCHHCHGGHLVRCMSVRTFQVWVGVHVMPNGRMIGSWPLL